MFSRRTEERQNQYGYENEGPLPAKIESTVVFFR